MVQNLGQVRWPTPGSSCGGGGIGSEGSHAPRLPLPGLVDDLFDRVLLLRHPDSLEDESKSI